MVTKTSEEEFFEKLGTKIKPLSRREKEQEPKASADMPGEGKQRKATQSGKLVQYVEYGTGYLPSPSTIDILPPGCYSIDNGEAGLFFTPTPINVDALLHFPDTRSELVIAEIEKFWKLDDNFKKFGFQHKRGFLLWGPPGSGKTCTVAMVIQNLVKEGGIVFLAQKPSLIASALLKFRSVEPDRLLVVVWEDLDAIINRFSEEEVLSVLDGESQVDHIVFLATTNYPERLDQRLINRPSRFDRIVKIEMPNTAARKLYLESKLGTIIAPDGTNLVEATKDFSVAHLRELIVGVYCFENDPKEVIERLKKMKVSPKSSDLRDPIGFKDEVVSKIEWTIAGGQ